VTAHNVFASTGLKPLDKFRIVVPKAFIVSSQHDIRWRDRFAVIVAGRRFENRKLDGENRIGGIGLSGSVSFGDSLRLDVKNGELVIEKER